MPMTENWPYYLAITIAIIVVCRVILYVCGTSVEEIMAKIFGK